MCVCVCALYISICVCALYISICYFIGQDAVVGSSANRILEDGKSCSEQCFMSGTNWNAWGRYLTVQRMGTNMQLSLTEVAIHAIPVGKNNNLKNVITKK